jgi:GAF domain-containing protein
VRSGTKGVLLVNHADTAERRSEIAEGLRDLLAVVNSGRPLDEILHHAVTQAVGILGGTAGALYLVEGEWLTVRAASGLTLDEVLVRLRVGSPVSGLAVARRQAVVCPDVAAGLEYAAESDRAVQVEDRGSHLRAIRIVDQFDTAEDLRRMHGLAQRFQAMLSVPLIVRDVAYGTLTLFYSEPRDVSDDEIGLALAFAGPAALVIENARLHARAEERLRELEALYQADEILHRSLRIADVLRAIVDVAADVLRAEKSAMATWDERRERLLVDAARGFLPKNMAMLQKAAGGLATSVARSGEPVVVEDARGDPRINQVLLRSEGIYSIVYVPIKIGDDVFGVFTLNYTQPRKVDSNQMRLLVSLAQKVALAIQNAQLFEQAQQAAVLEERQRLARDLHDAVNQTLFSASLIADVLPQLNERKPQEVGTRLEELRQLNRGALAEMRALLLALRSGKGE